MANHIMRSSLVLFIATAIAGCTGPAERLQSDSAPATNLPKNTSNTAVNSPTSNVSQTATTSTQTPMSPSAIAAALIGSSYKRSVSLPDKIADDWSVSSTISLADRGRPDFLTISKDKMLVLITASKEEHLGQADFRYVIRDSWAIVDYDGLVQASCSPTRIAAPAIFALINPNKNGSIALAAQIVPGSNQIVEMKQKVGAQYRCHYKVGKSVLTRLLRW